MDFEKIIDQIVEKTGCMKENTGTDEDLEYTLTFQIEDDRKQELVIYPFEEDTKSFVRLISTIGKKQEFSQAKLVSFLELNMSLRHGAFALYQGNVVLACTVHIIEEKDIERVIGQSQYLIKMADVFEKTLIGLDRN